MYVVSVLGTTGARAGLPPQVEETLRRARKAFNLPLALGFGLQHPDQLAAIPADIRPDAAVFGSALLKHLDKGNAAKAFLEVWARSAANKKAAAESLPDRDFHRQRFLLPHFSLSAPNQAQAPPSSRRAFTFSMIF